MADNASKTAIIVAIISLIGVLGGAIISNWDKLTANRTSQTQSLTSQQAGQPVANQPPTTHDPVVTPAEKPHKPAEVAKNLPEDALLGQWVSTFENPLFSVIDISREGANVQLRAYVNNHGPKTKDCVYSATLDGKRDVVAKGKGIEWQLPTLPLPCANWVQAGFTGASISVKSNGGSIDTLATEVTMFADQRVLGGSGPATYVRR